MAEILVAASPEPRTILERILDGHALCCAETLSQAEQLLRERPFDLIICTIAFDESAMFELLRLAKSKPEWQRIPLVCARVRGSVLRSPIAVEAVAFTCRELGAAAFLDVTDYDVDSEHALGRAIEQFLDSTSLRDPEHDRGA